MNEIVAEKKPSDLMAAHRAKMNRETSLNAALSEGVQDSFPTVSFRSGVWRVKFQGQEKIVTGPNNKPAVEFKVVILAASRHITKQWYEKAFDPNAAVRPPPDCASIDGIKPDSGVPKKQSETCAGCPRNVFGSAKPRDGVASKGKDCSDRRRIAVMIPPNILGELKPALLTIPPTSLKNLKDYSRKLDGMGLEANMVVTTLSFDPNAKQGGQVIAFEDDFVLPDREFEAILKLATDETIDRMLRAPIDAVNADPLDEDTQSRLASPEPKAYASFTEPVPTSHQKEETRPVNVGPIEPWPPDNTMQLKNGQWINTETGDFIEPPPIVPIVPIAPARNLKQLKNGQWIDLDTGEFVDPPGAKAQSPTKSEPEIIPPGEPLPGSFMAGTAPEDDSGHGEATRKPAEPAPGSAGAKRRGRPAKTATVEEAPSAAVSETETKVHGAAANGNGTGQTVGKASEKVLDVLSGLFPGS